MYSTIYRKFRIYQSQNPNDVYDCNDWHLQNVCSVPQGPKAAHIEVRQYAGHFADNFFKCILICILMNENVWTSIKISLTKFRNNLDSRLLEQLIVRINNWETITERQWHCNNASHLYITLKMSLQQYIYIKEKMTLQQYLYITERKWHYNSTYT